MATHYLHKRVNTLLNTHTHSKVLVYTYHDSHIQIENYIAGVEINAYKSSINFIVKCISVSEASICDTDANYNWTNLKKKRMQSQTF